MLVVCCLLLLLRSSGFVNESATAYEEGIYESFVQAHNNLAQGSIKWSWGELRDANINRSPSAYLNNPPEERALVSNPDSTWRVAQPVRNTA